MLRKKNAGKLVFNFRRKYFHCGLIVYIQHKSLYKRLGIECCFSRDGVLDEVTCLLLAFMWWWFQMNGCILNITTCSMRSETFRETVRVIHFCLSYCNRWYFSDHSFEFGHYIASEYQYFNEYHTQKSRLILKGNEKMLHDKKNQSYLIKLKILTNIKILKKFMVLLFGPIHTQNPSPLKNFYVQEIT